MIHQSMVTCVDYIRPFDWLIRTVVVVKTLNLGFRYNRRLC
jgi:hypothetical protein